MRERLFSIFLFPRAHKFIDAMEKYSTEMKTAILILLIILILLPHAQVSNCKADLLTRVRKMVVNERVEHPWKSMNDLELLKSADYVLKIHKVAKKVLLLLEFLSLGAKF